MTKLKRDEKLAAQIVEFHAAGQAGDLAAFKRLLGKHAAHLPKEKKEEMIAEFKRNVAALQAALRNE